MYAFDESIIFQYFDTLSSKQQEQFRQLGPCYKSWNNKLNLVSRRDVEHIYLKHVLHSLSIAKVVVFRNGARILDVGTGGGFPGIPLAIMFPQAEFSLIDSIGKKIRAVQQIAERLELTNVTTCQIRAEQVVARYDFILGRAVTSLNIFYGWVKHCIASTNQHSIPNGALYLKGTDTTSGMLLKETSCKYYKKITQITAQQRTYAIGDFFPNLFFRTKQLVHLYA